MIPVSVVALESSCWKAAVAAVLAASELSLVAVACLPKIEVSRSCLWFDPSGQILNARTNTLKKAQIAQGIVREFMSARLAPVATNLTITTRMQGPTTRTAKPKICKGRPTRTQGPTKCTQGATKLAKPLTK